MPRSPGGTRSAFEVEATDWWDSETSDWNALVGSAGPSSLPGGASMWSGMPAVDSKAVARLAPIFEKHFGKPLDTRLIRPGGYGSIGEAARDIEARFLARRSSASRTTTREARP